MTSAPGRTTCGCTSTTCAPSSGGRRAAAAAHGAGPGIRATGRAVSLRGRLSAAAAFGVLIVVGVVSGILFMSYAVTLRAVDADLVDAAQQAVILANQVKQASDKGPLPNLAKPITIGSIRWSSCSGRSAPDSPPPSARWARRRSRRPGARPAYFMTTRADGAAYRVYTAAMPGTQAGAGAHEPGGLRRQRRAACAGLLLAGLTLAAAAATYGLAWLSAGRILRPVAQLTAAAEHVTRPAIWARLVTPRPTSGALVPRSTPCSPRWRSPSSPNVSSSATPRTSCAPR